MKTRLLTLDRRYKQIITLAFDVIILVFSLWLSFFLQSDDVFSKHSLLTNDEIRIRELLKRHINFTNSKKAKNILENFEQNKKKFVKVLPIDFRNALLKKQDNKNDYKGVQSWRK